MLGDSSLLTYDNTRIVVLRGARKELIRIAHMAHMGVVCTYQSLRVHYYWKRMKADIETALQGCRVCLIYNPPGPKDPATDLEVPIKDLQPMEEIGLDIMAWGGGRTWSVQTGQPPI